MSASALEHTSVLERWLAALHGRGERTSIEAALTPEACIERHAPAPRAMLGQSPEPLERFEGHEAIARWLARTPVEAVFALAEPAHMEGEWLLAPYTITAGEFRNGGLWRARLEGHRIALLAHYPAALEG